MRSEKEVNAAIACYADMVRRICMMHLKNPHDTEDIFQNVFLKYMTFNGTFENQEHEKAWFARVAINACTDLLRSIMRHRTVPISEVMPELLGTTMEDEQRELLEVVLSLPDKYKDVIYLFYYEGYSALEIASILHKKENTIYSLLARGRALLKKQLGGDTL